MLPVAYATYRGTDPFTWPVVRLGMRVVYHSKVSGVPLVALVTCTQASYDPVVGEGKLKPPTTINHAHLKVFSPGDVYDEFDIAPGYGKGEWAPLEAGLA